MEYYFDSNPPSRSQWSSRHGVKFRGVIVLHTAETRRMAHDVDVAAWNVTSFIKGRSEAGSYHSLADSRNIVRLIDPAQGAYHVRGFNSTTCGVSFACHAGLWDSYPESWVEPALVNGAKACLEINDWARTNGLAEVPAKFVTLKEVKAGAAGFTFHSELDPSRRTDPGSRFPLDRFLRVYGGLKLNGEVPMNTIDPYRQPNDHSRAAQIAISNAMTALDIDLGFDMDRFVDGVIGGETVQAARAVEDAVKRVINIPPSLPSGPSAEHVEALRAIEALRSVL